MPFEPGQSLGHAFRRPELLDQAQRIAQERRFQRCKEHLDRFSSVRFRAGFV
jgi:hypothetical protein